MSWNGVALSSLPSEDLPKAVEEIGSDITEEDLKTLTVEQLRVVLRAFGLKISGRKADLISRVLFRGEDAKSEDAKSEDAKREEDKPDLGSDDVAKMKLAALRTALRELNLPTKGTVAELRTRYKAALDKKASPIRAPLLKKKRKSRTPESSSTRLKLSSPVAIQAGQRLKSSPVSVLSPVLHIVQSSLYNSEHEEERKRRERMEKTRRRQRIQESPKVEKKRMKRDSISTSPSASNASEPDRMEITEIVTDLVKNTTVALGDTKTPDEHSSQVQQRLSLRENPMEEQRSESNEDTEILQTQGSSDDSQKFNDIQEEAPVDSKPDNNLTQSESDINGEQPSTEDTSSKVSMPEVDTKTSPEPQVGGNEAQAAEESELSLSGAYASDYHLIVDSTGTMQSLEKNERESSHGKEDSAGEELNMSSSHKVDSSEPPGEETGGSSFAESEQPGSREAVSSDVYDEIRSFSSIEGEYSEEVASSKASDEEMNVSSLSTKSGNSGAHEVASSDAHIEIRSSLDEHSEEVASSEPSDEEMAGSSSSGESEHLAQELTSSEAFHEIRSATSKDNEHSAEVISSEHFSADMVVEVEQSKVDRLATSEPPNEEKIGSSSVGDEQSMMEEVVMTAVDNPLYKSSEPIPENDGLAKSVPQVRSTNIDANEVPLHLQTSVQNDKVSPTPKSSDVDSLNEETRKETKSSLLLSPQSISNEPKTKTIPDVSQTSTPNVSQSLSVSMSNAVSVHEHSTPAPQDQPRLGADNAIPMTASVRAHATNASTELPNNDTTAVNVLMAEKNRTSDNIRNTAEATSSPFTNLSPKRAFTKEPTSETPPPPQAQTAERNLLDELETALSEATKSGITRKELDHLDSVLRTFIKVPHTTPKPGFDPNASFINIAHPTPLRAPLSGYAPTPILPPIQRSAMPSSIQFRRSAVKQPGTATQRPPIPLFFSPTPAARVPATTSDNVPGVRPFPAQNLSFAKSPPTKRSVADIIVRSIKEDQGPKTKFMFSSNQAVLGIPPSLHEELVKNASDTEFSFDK